MSPPADESLRPAAVPDKPVLEGLEAKWDADWEASGIYRFDETRPRAEVFSIDTPPPTVSGSLHVGHVFSYTHTDIIARYRRMAGQAVFYPMGWDDNGLPTERRVQNYYGVRCDPSLPYDPDFAAPPDAGRPSAVAKRRTIAVSRPNFIELCEELTASDERAFEDLFRRIGLSVDWTRTYATIDAHCRR
ncbi:MAG: valine--tRNA ligase, partial [Acidimicrobiaceae bacterium]|nr:valine--tRNA ligase [Acidimicrobiaceae bacterium]